MKTKNEIIKLLTNDKRLRDSDSKLIARFWSNELEVKGIDVKKITAYDFLCLFATGKLHNTEGLTRMRRKVQEENKELRGERYYERKTKLTNHMKEKLGYPIDNSCKVPQKRGYFEY